MKLNYTDILVNMPISAAMQRKRRKNTFVRHILLDPHHMFDEDTIWGKRIPLFLKSMHAPAIVKQIN